MKKILLACNAGMSTSMLVQKMRTAAKEMNVEADINAVSVTELNDIIGDVDVVMLGPQVKFQKAAVVELAAGRTPVDVIDMRDYGMMNGKKVLQTALDLIEKEA
ncbi:MAG: PTS sugar transporter subunit IIB [Lachnospiraceae bacterium]|nr:PTS sugar transporter subunit IIB [Lachnospiraceae bacterium]MDY5496432.1 PTS sugar transporter subunit IIB [Anaerobutyricum sp.]